MDTARFSYSRKGQNSNEQLTDWYARIDAIILPTLVYENSPTVIYEAFASGIPVMVSNIGGAAELVSNEALGEKVKPGDPEDLTNAINIVIKRLRNHEYSQETIQASVKMLDVRHIVKMYYLFSLL